MNLRGKLIFDFSQKTAEEAICIFIQSYPDMKHTAFSLARHFYLADKVALKKNGFTITGSKFICLEKAICKDVYDFINDGQLPFSLDQNREVKCLLIDKIDPWELSRFAVQTILKSDEELQTDDEETDPATILINDGWKEEEILEILSLNEGYKLYRS